VKLPIDTSAIAFLCAMPPEPVVDFETRRPKADDNGEPLYVIQLPCHGGRLRRPDRGQGARGAVGGHPPGRPVKVTGLVAQPWTMADRSGVSFRALRVEPAMAAAKAS
jgi:hypothetical protein